MLCLCMQMVVSATQKPDRMNFKFNIWFRCPNRFRQELFEPTVCAISKKVESFPMTASTIKMAH